MNSALITSVLAASSLIGGLPQTATNGLSTFGTLDAPTLPKFLTNNPLPQGFPWGGKTVDNTNPYTDPPVTGVIRNYDFTISRGYLAPDGVNRSVLLINGQFPAPLIEANWGDTIQVTVHNDITGPEEGSALHWHGILQKTSQWMDGVPSVGQCPIPPGGNFTYTFQADLYGSSWYHSHYSAQYAGGLLGPMIIYGPNEAEYDIDLGPILLTDWNHEDYFTLVEQTVKPQSEGGQPLPISDNNLIQGKGIYDCNLITDGTACTNLAGLAKFQFEPGKVHRLRLINAGADGVQKFTIDGHRFTVIANDFVPVVPYETNVITLGIGQRTDVLVTASLTEGSSVWMRSILSEICAVGQRPIALGAVYYSGANTSSTPSSLQTEFGETVCGNDPLIQTVPRYPIAAEVTPATTQVIDITTGQNSTGSTLWFMNNQTFRGNYDHPILLLAKLGNTSYPDDPQWNVYNFGSNSSVRIVLQNQTPVTHPIHLHGHNFFVITEGLGQWDGITMIRPTNPQRRDVQLLRPEGYLVLQFETDNPGVWPLHCHIAWHVSGGLYVNVMERPDDIANLPIPSIMAQTCRDWADYSGHNVVMQIDSGL